MSGDQASTRHSTRDEPEARLRVTRLAPSPTGALHLGNARTFLINWAMARQAGWTVRMRIEDLDGPRIKPGAGEAAIDVLRWLGLDWDGPVMTQSEDLIPYRAALEHMAKMGCVFPCSLTRREVEAAASAPHGRSPSVAAWNPTGASQGPPAGASGERRYPTELRPDSLPREIDWTPGRNWRYATPDRLTRFDDHLCGPQQINVFRDAGDFVVWTKDDQPAYQLAVVVDDSRQGVTDIVRGDDLLDSTARQLLLIEAMDLHPRPSYTHLPLVIGEDGRRLAKRHGDTRIATYRDAGVPAERIVGLMAWWSGVTDERKPMTADAFADAFRLQQLPREATVFTAADDAWLRDHASG